MASITGAINQSNLDKLSGRSDSDVKGGCLFSPPLQSVDLWQESEIASIVPPTRGVTMFDRGNTTGLYLFSSSSSSLECSLRGIVCTIGWLFKQQTSDSSSNNKQASFTQSKYGNYMLASFVPTTHPPNGFIGFGRRTVELIEKSTSGSNPISESMPFALFEL